MSRLITDEEAQQEFEKHNCTISADLAGILARSIQSKLKEKWQGLTDEDMQIAFDDTQEASGGFWDFARAIEAKLKEKNT
jgi:hypothetical protein